MLFKLFCWASNGPIFSVIENRQKKVCNNGTGVTFKIVNCSNVEIPDFQSLYLNLLTVAGKCWTWLDWISASHSTPHTLHSTPHPQDQTQHPLHAPSLPPLHPPPLTQLRPIISWREAFPTTTTAPTTTTPGHSTPPTAALCCARWDSSAPGSWLQQPQSTRHQTWLPSQSVHAPLSSEQRPHSSSQEMEAILRPGQNWRQRRGIPRTGRFLPSEWTRCCCCYSEWKWTGIRRDSG